MKKEIVNHWIEKSYRTLDSAKCNFHGKLYNQLYYLREEADYFPNLKISKEKVKELLDETEMFMKNLERIIKNSI